MVVESIAPEDIRFSPAAREEDKASFLDYVWSASSSDLVRLGLPTDEIDDLRSERDLSAEEAQRTEGLPDSDTRSGDGDSERPIWLVVAWVRADDDGDGISELLRVVYAHAGGTGSRTHHPTHPLGGTGRHRAGHANPHAAHPRRPLLVRPDQGPPAARLRADPRPARQPLPGQPAAARSVSDQVNIDSLIDWGTGLAHPG